MSTLTIAVFGGTGRTGQHIVRQALQAGHQVRTLARNPSKMKVVDERLTVVHGDATDGRAVAEVVAGSNAVINTVGHTKTSTPDVQTVSTQHIVDAMQQQGMRRLVSLSGAGLDHPNDVQNFGRKLMKTMMNLLAKDVLTDAEAHAEVLRSSDLDWTVARPPRLTNGPAQGNYRTGYFAAGPGDKLSRADLADFLLRLATGDEYVGEMPNVLY
ncbi:MAG: SDR family oxidoreductase [Catalinimonas sp.]